MNMGFSSVDSKSLTRIAKALERIADQMERDGRSPLSYPVVDDRREGSPYTADPRDVPEVKW